MEIEAKSDITPILAGQSISLFCDNGRWRAISTIHSHSLKSFRDALVLVSSLKKEHN